MLRPLHYCIVFTDLLQSSFQPLQCRLPLSLHAANGLRHSGFVPSPACRSQPLRSLSSRRGFMPSCKVLPPPYAIGWGFNK